jgi:Alg9-like mannosyltransferase family
VRGKLLVLLFVVVSSAARLYLAHEHYGFQTGDDLEIAEEAFRRAVGLEHPPWNIRSLLIPDVLVAPFVAGAHAAGVRDPLLLATIARYPFILLSALNIALVYLLGRRWYDEWTGVAASAVYAVHWIPLVYGSSLYPRTLAVTCILGAAILLGERTGTVRAALAGVLAALAVTARYSEAIFFASLLLAVKWRRGWSGGLQPAAAFAASFALGVCVFVGLYDRLTWGQWFGSLREFAELVFVERDASSLVVRQAPWWYVGNLLHWVPATTLPLLYIAVRRSEARRAIAFIAVPLIALSAIFHKELRYLQVIVPFVLLLAARGFMLLRETRPRLALALLLLALPLGIARIGVVERRSTNAATAALWMAERRVPHIALSQPWAYGGRLFFGNDVRITDVKIPPELLEISAAAPSAVAVFTSDVNDALRTACAEKGLSRTKTFADRGGRDVTVFH